MKIKFVKTLDTQEFFVPEKNGQRDVGGFALDRESIGWPLGPDLDVGKIKLPRDPGQCSGREIKREPKA